MGDNEHINEDNEELNEASADCEASFGLLLGSNCDISTHLFHTLSPISHSRINEQSTPFVAPIVTSTDRRRDALRDQTFIYELISSDNIHESRDSAVDELQIDDQIIRSRDNDEAIERSDERLIEEIAPNVEVETSGAMNAEHNDRDVDRDALAAKVAQLLGRTRMGVFDDFDAESLGLIRVIDTTETSGSSKANSDIMRGRSEPDGNGKPYNLLQTQKTSSDDTNNSDVKLVHYSSSESETDEDRHDDDDGNEGNKFENNVPKGVNTLDVSSTGIRYRSYSASSGTDVHSGPKSIASGVSFLREKLKLRASLQKSSAATGTQTLRSFLAEQSQHEIHDSGSTNASNTDDSSAVEMHKSTTTSDDERNRENLDSENIETGIPLLPQQNYEQFIYIPTGKKENDMQVSRNGSDVSSGAPLERALDVLKTSNSSTSVKSSSSEDHKENRPMNAKSYKNVNKPNRVQEVQERKKDSQIMNCQSRNISDDQSAQHSNALSLATKKSKHSEAIIESSSTSRHHKREFKHLVERQKNYLKCLQRELLRLEKMETLFVKLHGSHTSSKNSSQSSKLVKRCQLCGHNFETSPSISTVSTNKRSDKQNTTNKSSSETPSSHLLSSSQSETPLNYFAIKDNYTTTSKSSVESSNHVCCRHCSRNHKFNAQKSPKRTHSLSIKTATTTTPKQILVNGNPVKTTKTSKAIQTSQSLLNFETFLELSDQMEKKLNILSKNRENEPIAWFIPIIKNGRLNSDRKLKQRKQTSYTDINPSSKYKQTSTPITLQEAFNRNCRQIRRESQLRIHRINQLAEARKSTADQRIMEMARAYEKQKSSAKIIEVNYEKQSIAFTTRRVFTHKEMREQTERMYVNLPEVKAFREKKKREEKEKNHRLMAQLYKYKLKDNALKGRVTWPLTHLCLTY